VQSVMAGKVLVGVNYGQLRPAGLGWGARSCVSSPTRPRAVLARESRFNNRVGQQHTYICMYRE